MPLALLESSIFKMSFSQVFLSTWEKTVQLKLSYKGDAEVSAYYPAAKICALLPQFTSRLLSRFLMVLTGNDKKISKCKFGLDFWRLTK